MQYYTIPVWDDILTPLYIDPGVNILYDILTPGSIYRNDILTPLMIFWPPSQQYIKQFCWLCMITKRILLYLHNVYEFWENRSGADLPK